MTHLSECRKGTRKGLDQTFAGAVIAALALVLTLGMAARGFMPTI